MNMRTLVTKETFPGVKLLLFAYILLVLAAFVLPFFSVEEYSIVKNTTSHLGAQNAPNAWMMNVVFILLGISSIIDSWVRLSGFWLHKVVIIVFGISLLLTGIFQHAPITQGVQYSEYKDNMHSIFASITGYSFVFFAVASGFIEKTKARRILAISVGCFASLCSFLFFNLPDFAGIWQRLIFLSSFAWLLYFSYT